MKILLTGASGFIGRHVAAGLLASGHEVIEVVRRPQSTSQEQVQGDFAHDTEPVVWLPRLAGVDVVINAVGIVRQSGMQSFSALHIQGPRALFAACAQAGISKVIQISALGADENATSRFHVSKASADRYLQSLPLRWIVLRPSLVFGLGGASTRLFAGLASMPLVPLVGAGDQAVQPLHIDDLVELCVRLVSSSAFDCRTIDVVGPRACTVKSLLNEFRGSIGIGPPRFVSVPRQAVRATAVISEWLPGSVLDREALDMLYRGNTADVAGFAAALGREPRGPFPVLGDGASGSIREAMRAWAREAWTMPLLRWSVALVWILTGLLSLGIYPVADSLALLARLGLTGAAATTALFGAATLDLLLGLGVLLLQRRTWLWRIQCALILGYSGAIAVALPEFMLHPFGPLLKNVVLLAVIVVLHETERFK